MIVVIILIPLGIFALADYKTVATDNFTVYYRDGWEVEALKILQVMEDSRPYVEELTGNKVGNTPIVLENMGNEVNGYVNLFGPKIALFAYPPSSDILSNGQDWWQLVGTHEYIHRTQMTVCIGLALTTAKDHWQFPLSQCSSANVDHGRYHSLWRKPVITLHRADEWRGLQLHNQRFGAGREIALAGSGK